jgi:hypothetical protein
MRPLGCRIRPRNPRWLLALVDRSAIRVARMDRPPDDAFVFCGEEIVESVTVGASCCVRSGRGVHPHGRVRRARWRALNVGASGVVVAIRRGGHRRSRSRRGGGRRVGLCDPNRQGRKKADEENEPAPTEARQDHLGISSVGWSITRLVADGLRINGRHPPPGRMIPRDDAFNDQIIAITCLIEIVVVQRDLKPFSKLDPLPLKIFPCANGVQPEPSRRTQKIVEVRENAWKRGHGRLGFVMVGVNRPQAVAGLIPDTRQWNGLSGSGSLTIVPPAARISPAVVTPTRLCGIPFESSSTDLPGALLTEEFLSKPFGSSSCCRLRKTSSVFDPPRTTRAASGSSSAATTSDVTQRTAVVAR